MKKTIISEVKSIFRWSMRCSIFSIILLFTLACNSKPELVSTDAVAEKKEPVAVDAKIETEIPMPEPEPEPENNPPTLKSMKLKTKMNTNLDISLIAKDLDEDDLTFYVSSNSKHQGQISFDDRKMHAQYSPQEGFYGEDIVIIIVSDGIDTDEASFYIDVELHEDTLQNTCNTASQEEYSFTLVFEENQSEMCLFGNGDNAARNDRIITAIRNQNVEIMPGNSLDEYIICSLSIQTDSNFMWRYDDFMFMSVNNNVIGATYKKAVDKLSELNGIAQFDWSKIKGLNFSEIDGEEYSLNTDSFFPGHDQQGPVNFSVNVQDFPKLSLNLLNKISKNNPLNFDLYITGDNDNSDCKHTGLIFYGEMTYVKLKTNAMNE